MSESESDSDITRALTLGEILYIMAHNFDKCYTYTKGLYVMYDSYDDENVIKGINKQNISDDEKELLNNTAIGHVVYLPKKLMSSFTKCKTRYFAVPLYIHRRHWNILIFDTKKKVVERFEPLQTSDDYDSIDLHLSKIFFDHHYDYKSSEQFCIHGPQHTEGIEVGQETHNCGFWGLLYLELKLQSQESTQDEILETLLQLVKKDGAHKTITRFKRDIVKYIEKNQKAIDKYNDMIEDKYNQMFRQTKYYQLDAPGYTRVAFGGKLKSGMNHRYIGYDGRDTMFEEDPSLKKYLICTRDQLKQIDKTSVEMEGVSTIVHSTGHITMSSKKDLKKVYTFLKNKCGSTS